MGKGQVTHKAAGVGPRGGYPTIGLLCREISSEYAMAIWNGVSGAAQEREANLICVLGGNLGLARHSEDGMANQLYDLLDADTFDGLVVWGAQLGNYSGPQAVQALCERYRPLPVVNIGLELEGIPNVLADNYQGTRDAVAHLIEAHGCRRIAYLAGPEANWEARERYRGYTSALTEHEIPFDPALVARASEVDERGFRFEGYQEVGVHILMDERGLRPRVDFEAVMTHDDDLGLRAMNALQARGVQVPGEVAVASFDDVGGAWCVTPPLTTVRQPLYDLGRQAAEMLLDWVKGAAAPASRILPMQVAVRQSCGCASEAVTQAVVESVAHAGEGVRLDAALAGQREAILAELSRAAGPALADADPAWAERLLDGFINGLEKASPGVFLGALENTLNRVALMDGDLQIWQEVLSTFRRGLLPCLSGDTLSRAEHLWQQARMMVGEVARRVQAHRALRKAQRTQASFEIGRSLITTFDVPALMDRLVEGLPRLGIPGCYLAVYEDPQSPTTWSRLILAYDESGRVNLGDGSTEPSGRTSGRGLAEVGGRRFASRRWVSEGVLPLGGDSQPARPRSYIAEPLYFREHQIGFALVEVGPREGMVYELLRGEVSSALYGAQLVQQAAHRAVQLQTAAEVSRAASSLLDPDALIRQVVDLVRERFELYYVGLFLVDRSGAWTGEPGRWVVLRAGTGDVGRELLRVGHKLEIGGSSIVGWCVARKQPRVAPDVGAEAVRFNNPLLPETRSELALPLVSRGEAIGALTIQSSRAAAFGEQDVAAFQTMADQLANAICNADLYEQAQKAQEAAEAAQSAAEAANRAKSVFLANMSHELRTPLNAILGYADILKRRADSTRPLVDGLDIIHQSGEHLLTLINDVLDLAKVEAGKLDLTPAPFHLPTFLRQIVDIIRARAEAKDLSLTYEALSPLPATVVADETRLRQVLLNLLGNAVKFTDRGHVALTVETLAEAQAGEAQVALRFRVEDTGPGIPADQLARIFLPFEQTGEVGRRAEGTGLGLAISQQIVQLMGGRLVVESEPGQGSTFWFDVTLPLTEVAAREEPAPPRNVVGYAGPRRVVLVADDKRYNRLLLVDMLEPLGFEVHTASDGQQALDKALALQPDAIVMDLVMPVKTGFEAVREMRQRSELKEMTIIAASASVLEADQEKSRVAGCDAFLPKPIKTERLLDLLATHLKLSWIYAEPEVEADAISGLLVPPPPEELAALLTLAKSGRILDIRARAIHLAEMDAAYIPFSDKLQALAKSFEIDQVKAFVEQYIETGLVPPPQEELAILLDLARRGDMRAIQEQAAHLGTLGEPYVPFARKLRELAKGFEEREILALVEQYVE